MKKGDNVLVVLESTKDGKINHVYGKVYQTDEYGHVEKVAVYDPDVDLITIIETTRLIVQLIEAIQPVLDLVKSIWIGLFGTKESREVRRETKRIEKFLQSYSIDTPHVVYRNKLLPLTQTVVVTGKGHIRRRKNSKTTIQYLLDTGVHYVKSNDSYWKICTDEDLNLLTKEVSSST